MTGFREECWERVFVYGSLKRGLVHHDQMAGAIFQRTASLLGFYLVLYEDAYPALVRALETEERGEIVEGELFLVSLEHLERLDQFEECPELYQRTPVTLTDGERAYAYSIERARAARYARLAGPWRGLSCV